MQKYLLPVLASLLLCFTTSCSKKTTDAATTAASGGTDYAALAATYKKNPEALRQLIEDCEVTEQQLVTTQQQLNQYRSQSGSTEQDLNALRNNLASEQQANDQLRQQLAQAQAAAANRPSAGPNDRLDTDENVVVSGVIFQVQLGAFAKNTVNSDLSTGNALELQEQNGLQKFVVSQFRTYASAAKLRDRLKVMGVKDAFVVAKQDGVRISVPDALRITGQN
ncbi:hypothetical protein [Neolewinella agarilytica]|uniref:Sporulation related domain-containing protein n=1 Tax=Neolewinella agarilytica TaxID=478744 RepID=A0A1H9LIP2_9BACT|nr:hypothetical protein [Neolewinella agarilytica]SER11274.1 hypothetical protein SAMN05444359_12454 [Neolewinella agarilytica]